MRERDFEELAAGHALNALSPEDERAYRDAVSADASRADLAEADTETAALLADATSPVTPPDRIRAELLARIAATPQHTASTAESRSPEAAGEGTAPGEPTRRAWGPRAWFALAASLVLLGGGGAAAIIATQSLTRPAAVVALDRIESAPDARSAGAEVAGGGDATLHWSVELGAAVLVSRDLPEIAEDRQFELWYVRGDEAIPAGVFDASAETTTALLEEGMRPGDVIAVTVEPHGGSPDGRPSTDPIVAIPTE